MNRIKLPLTAIILTTALSGCIIVDGDYELDYEHWRNQQTANLDKINDLSIGAQRAEALDQLGTPAFSEAFVQEGHEYRILFYRTQHRHADGETSKDETTPLVFKDDTLIGWGDDALNRIR